MVSVPWTRLRAVQPRVLSRLALPVIVALLLLMTLRFGLSHLRFTTAWRSTLGEDLTRWKSPSLAATATGTRPLVLYAYQPSATAWRNLVFFADQGLHAEADFVFILKDAPAADAADAADLLPKLPNIRVVNSVDTCAGPFGAFGAFGEVLQRDGLWKRYRRFVLLDGTVRGPFLPTYASAECWTDVFLGRLTDEVKLVGTTINCEPRPHVQSMVWATDDVGMSVLLGPVQTEDDRGTENAAVGLGTCYKTPGEAKHAEFGSTDLIQAQGYKVDVLMAAYGEKEEWDAEEYCEKNGQPEDVLLRDGSYFGTNLHPYETVFFPADRGVADKTLDDFTKWHQKRRLTSWDTCKKRKH